MGFKRGATVSTILMCLIFTSSLAQERSFTAQPESHSFGSEQLETSSLSTEGHETTTTSTQKLHSLATISESPETPSIRTQVIMSTSPSAQERSFTAQTESHTVCSEQLETSSLSTGRQDATPTGTQKLHSLATISESSETSSIRTQVIMSTSPSVSTSPVPADCLKCICKVESNCKIPKPLCHMDGGSLSCGPYQIKQAYWQDARLKGGTLDGDWKICAKSFDCSERAVQGYMARYATAFRLGHQPTCEDFARIHNGGPNGYKKSATDGYWAKVKKCLDTNLSTPKTESTSILQTQEDF